MAEHVCCITTSLLGVDVDFATRVATVTWQNSCLMWITRLPFGLFCCTSTFRKDHRTYWKHLPVIESFYGNFMKFICTLRRFLVYLTYEYAQAYSFRFLILLTLL